MRYSEKELAHYGCSSTADLEGRLNYRPPSGNFSQSGFKERWFKLKANFLFYFRITELGVIDKKEPAGVFILENFSVQTESTPGIPFSFSIVFRDDNDRKHIFSTRTQDQTQQWVASLKSCSYEHWRSQLRHLQSKIKIMTGKDPLLMYPGYNQSFTTPLPAESLSISALSLSPARPARSPNRKATSSSFKSHLPAGTTDSIGKLQMLNSNPRPTSFQIYVPVSSTSSPLPIGTAKALGNPQFNTPSVNPVNVLPAPSRPSRSSNRPRASDVPFVATRSAPPPPSGATQNLIEF